MDARTLRALGLDVPTEAQQPTGLPQPGAFGGARYSSGGLSRTLAQPYNQSGGIVRQTADAGSNPGEMDPLLAAQIKMGDRGGYLRGASAFLGAGYNPFTKEMNGQGEWVSNPNQNLDTLFDEAQRLGIDTSKYSRDSTTGIRGERGQNDSMQLYDDLNQLTKDYVAVDHMSPDGKNSERTMYVDRGGQLIPVSPTQSRSGRIDGAFFGDDFKEMLSTVGLAALGGALAAPAAAGASAGSAGAGAAGASAGAGATTAAGSAWSALPQWGRSALSGALQGGLSSGLQGGNILQGALTGGVTGAAGSAVNGAVSGLDLPKWATSGLSGAVRGGLGAALNGGNVLSGALSGGVSGGLSGAGLPSGVANVGGRVLANALSGEGQSGGNGSPTPSATAPSGGGIVAALGGVNGGSGGVGSDLYDPNAARGRSALASALLNRRGRAGDTRADNPLVKALQEL